MSIPSIIGPIETGESFMITSIQNGDPFVLNSVRATGPTGSIRYYWESNINEIATNDSMGIFTAAGTIDDLTIHDSKNRGGIGFIPSSTIVTHTSTPAQIIMEQSSFADWFPPDIFLSAVTYTMYTPAGATATILTGVTGMDVIPADNLIILPVVWYSNCTSNGRYEFINVPLKSLINWFCLVKPGITGCDSIQLESGGWTNLPDCTAGVNYTYCPTGTTCGNSNCNGPCPSIEYDCTLSNNNYVCEFDIRKFFSDTEWWQSPYFIGAVIAGILIIVIIIILIYVLGRRT